MKVSILVPIYGVEKYIERCIRSLFEQTYENIEFIFVNDCTKDSSIDILRRVMDDYPSRKNQVRIIEHSANKGLAGARNTAVEASTGDFVVHVDSDDYVDKRMIEVFEKKQRESNADIISCNFVTLWPKCKKTYSNILPYESSEAHSLAVVRRTAHMGVWAQFIRKSLYVDNGIQTLEGVNMGEDYQVVPKLFYYASKTAVVLDHLYYYDRTNESSYTNVYSVAKFEQSWKSFDTVKMFFDDKESPYKEAVLNAEIAIIVAHLIISEKVPRADFYYEEAIRRLSLIEKKYWKGISFFKRIVLYFANHRNLMITYIKFSKFFVK